MSDSPPIDPEAVTVWEAQRLILDARADAGLPDSIAFEEVELRQGLTVKGELITHPSQEEA